MSNYIYTGSDLISIDELKHYGRKGMKWGQNIFGDKQSRATRREYSKDKSEYRSAKRHVAAGKKNLRTRGQMQDEDFRKFNKASSDLSEASTKVVMPWNRDKKQAAIKEATDSVKDASAKLQESRSEMHRANRMYDEDAAELERLVKDIQTKYGKDKVADLKYKEIQLGEHSVKKVIKTGLTVAELPVVGTWYSGYYNGGKDYQDRLNAIESEARKKKY